MDHDALSSGGRLIHGDDAGFGHGEADNTDDNGDGQRNDTPDGTYAAAELQLAVILDCHEVVEDMGHTEVAKTPGQGGENHQRSVAACLTGVDVGGSSEAEVAGDLLCVCNDGINTAGGVDAEDENNDESKGHDNALDKACDRGCHEAAHCAVSNNDDSGDDHGGHVIKTEEGVEKLAAGGEAGSGIGYKENDNGDGADDLNKLGVVSEAACKEVGNSDGAQLAGVESQSLRNDEPVEVGAQSQTNGGPAGLSHTAEQSQTGNAHQQICTHIGGFSTHCGDNGAHLSGAEVKILGGLIGRVLYADKQHTHHIDCYSSKNNNRCSSHKFFLSFSSDGPFSPPSA